MSRHIERHPFINDNLSEARPLKNAGQNEALRLIKEGESYFVRKYRKTISTVTVEREAKLIVFLAENGLPVPNVYTNGQDELVSRADDGAPFFIQEFIDGDFFPSEGLELNSKQLENTAKTLARLHQVLITLDNQETPADVTSFTSEQFFSVSSARSIWETALTQATAGNSELDYLILSVAQEKLQEINSLNIEAINTYIKILPRILAHGDFTPQNLIYKGDEVISVIDWELARYQPRAWEVTRAICSFCKQGTTEFFNTPIDMEKMKIFLEAYQSQNPLTTEELLLSIPDMAYLASLYPVFLLSTRYQKHSSFADKYFSLNPNDWTWWRDNKEVALQAIMSLTVR